MSQSPIETTEPLSVKRPSTGRDREGSRRRKEDGWLGAIFDALLAPKLAYGSRLFNLKRYSLTPSASSVQDECYRSCSGYGGRRTPLQRSDTEQFVADDEQQQPVSDSAAPSTSRKLMDELIYYYYFMNIV